MTCTSYNVCRITPLHVSKYPSLDPAAVSEVQRLQRTRSTTHTSPSALEGFVWLIMMDCAPHRYPSRLNAYLDDLNDSPLPAHLAARSRLPKIHTGSSNPNNFSSPTPGTSLLLQNSTATSYGSLPGLYSPITDHAAQSVTSSEGIRDLHQRLRLLDILPDGCCVLPRPHPMLLECPFNFLSCYEQFDSYADWYRHSLTHFNSVGPPRCNKCCFCDASFGATTGEECWHQRLEHVAMHHQLGHSLAHARFDFVLHRHLRRNRLVSTVDFVSRSRGCRPRLAVHVGSNG